MQPEMRIPTRVRDYELTGLLPERFWIGRQVGAPSDARPVIVKVFPTRTQGLRAAREAHLILQLPPEAGLSLVEAGEEAALGLDYYVMLAQGLPALHPPVPLAGRSLNDATVRMAARLMALHSIGIAYRTFGRHSFLFTNGVPIPFDFSRAHKMDDRGRVPSPSRDHSLLEHDRRSCEFDAPETVDDFYDAVRADTYGLGVLLRQIGADRLEHGDIVGAMVAETPELRPDLASIVRRFSVDSA